MMDVQLKSIKDYLEKNNYECVYVTNSKRDFLFVDIYINNEVIRLKCVFPIGFPYEFPKIYILKAFYKKYHQLPHVDKEGLICIFDTNKVFPNINKPEMVTLECIKKAQNILQDGINEENLDDFYEEISSYWLMESTIIGDLIFSPGDKVKKLFYYKKNNKIIFLSDNKKKLIDYIRYSKELKINNSKIKEAIYIPLNSLWKPPFNITNREMFECLKEEKYYNEYVEYMRDNSSNRIVIFSQKLNDSIFIGGWEHKKVKTPNGFRNNSIDPLYLYKIVYGNNAINKININQLGHKRLFERGGDGNIKENIKVSISGCGSIGSYLTKTLIGLGINKFHLIDNDILTSENIARHYCGASYMMQYKVDSMKKEILKHYPDIECDISKESIFEVINNNLEIFNGSDLNFIAVGNIAIENKFISLFNNMEIRKPIILVWVEPYLIGGHAIVLQKKQDISSFFDYDFSFKNRVILNGEEYIKKESGCHSTFLPYSAFEMQLFISNIIDFINKKMIEKNDSGNYILSWCGRIDKARREYKGMKINSSWISSNGREFKVLKLRNEEI